MARQPLSPEETALWGRVSSTVRPLAGRRVDNMVASEVLKIPPISGGRAAARILAPSTAPIARQAQHPSANTLDANWDKRLATGTAVPDRTIDLHGHTLASAHQLLDRALGDAIRSGARLVLLITGRPPRDNPRLPPTQRGVIRASVGDWLAASPHAGQIAAVRNAHPRHGGAGALYLVIRRDRRG